VPLLDQYGVDLVINGHNHIYERANLLKRGKSKKTPIGAKTYPAVDGNDLRHAGGAGRSLYSFPVPDSYAGPVNDLDSVPSYVWRRRAPPRRPARLPARPPVSATPPS
jgi:hypothetical protein